MADVEFSSRAFCKMLLHCAKYPHCAVNGVLLAENSKTKDSKGDSNLLFIDAIPLFHICLHLSPMYEVALTQIDHMATSKGLVIAGYYLANENYRDISSEAGHKLADKIADNFPSACFVTIDNRKFPSLYDYPIASVPLIVSQYSDGKWKTKDKSNVYVSEETMYKTSHLLMKRMQDLVDFDNHLDDISLDWKNTRLNQEIDEASSN